jgi:hypothetical protein
MGLLLQGDSQFVGINAKPDLGDGHGQRDNQAQKRIAMNFLPPALGVCQERACFAENETSAIAILPTQEDRAVRYGAEYGQRTTGLVEVGLHVLDW